MLQMKIDIKSFKEFLNLVSMLNQEVKVDFTQEGFFVKTMDQARISLMEIRVNKDALQEYMLDSDFTLGLDTEAVKNFLKVAPQGIMEMSENQGKLSIKVGLLSAGFGEVDPTLINVPAAPKMEYTNSFIADRSALKEGFTAADMISDFVKISMDASGVKITAEKEPDHETTMELSLPREQLKEFVHESDARSYFSMDYFVRLLQGADSVGEFKVSIGQDYPLKLESDFLHGKGKLLFIMAPRLL
jgi:proliferating cell nuclear antigen